MRGPSTLAWLIGIGADVIWPALVLAFAVLFLIRGGQPRLGGLRWIGGAMALWGLTELLSWPFQNDVVYDMIYEVLGAWIGANYASISRLIGTVIAAVCWGLGGVGALKLASDLAPAPEGDA